MQGDARILNGKGFLSHEYELGCTQNSALNDHYPYSVPFPPQFLSPLSGLEFQPLENCPKNFIIFDHTYDKGSVMFHPALVRKLGSPNLDLYPSHHAEKKGKISSRKNDICQDKFSSSFEEDSKDIDALLCSDEEGNDGKKDDDDDDDDDDVVSTGRTPDFSCSGKHEPSFSQDFTFDGSISKEKKREKMRKMVRVLREIIPGGDRLDAPAVLDEAVRYLKYLKVEVKKLGLQNFDDQSCD
ncbi:transcription factor bHLH144-like [Ananas comosus]|uniref:Transcription factor bHLH144-like n=1 Tax=Ananas comosus TaxID=4615 RepID=A0A6P5FRB5_ANACO|nr:transcription factor bHLH144-like [Ananas comosus]